MKIMFISDIHGIKKNLEFIKNKYEELICNKLVVLGDLYYSGFGNQISKDYDARYVMDFLLGFKEQLICLKGNCDSDLDIKVSDFPICSDLALLNVDNLDMYLTHGNNYSIDKRGKFNRKGILIYGHTHIPFIKKVEDMLYINPGSISLPRGEYDASYMIYEDRNFIIYDINDLIVDTIKIEG